MSEANTKTTSFKNRIIWILLEFILTYIVLGTILIAGAYLLAYFLLPWNISSAVKFILENYLLTFPYMVLFFVWTSLTKRNRFIFDEIIPFGKQNQVKYLLYGLAAGFAVNAVCVLCAWLYGDIRLIFSFSLSEIPFLLFALACVFIQSASEELWFRGFLLKRINVHYPLWAAMLVSSIVFTLLHAGNPGFSVIAAMHLMIDAFVYCLGNLKTKCFWFAAGIHTGWNFTQNLIFGLPNSGVVSEASVFRLIGVSGRNSLFYDYVFGVEGGLPAVIFPLIFGIILYFLLKKENRLQELQQSRESLGSEG